MDIETIKFNSDIQTPIAITSCGYIKGKLQNKIFLIDHILLNKDKDLAVKELWNKYLFRNNF